MPSGPQIPTPTPSDLSGEITDDLALYQEKFRRRLPESLDDLCGPARGVVDLPLRIAWSGMTSYDLGKPRQRMGLYRTVLHESLRDDLPRYLNHDLFLQLWPVAHGDHHASSAACPLCRPSRPHAVEWSRSSEGCVDGASGRLAPRGRSQPARVPVSDDQRMGPCSRRVTWRASETVRRSAVEASASASRPHRAAVSTIRSFVAS